MTDVICAAVYVPLCVCVVCVCEFWLCHSTLQYNLITNTFSAPASITWASLINDSDKLIKFFIIYSCALLIAGHG